MQTCLPLPVRILPIVAIAWLSIQLVAGGAGQTPATDTLAGKPALTGLGVFGKALGVHGTVQVNGDLVLKQADVVGEGTLVLEDTEPRQLIAEASTVNRLVIDNPAGVTLQGDLGVHQRLTIRHGAFDVRQAHLHVADSGQVIVFNGAQLQQHVGWALAKAPRPARGTTGGSEGWLLQDQRLSTPELMGRPNIRDDETSSVQKPEPLIALPYPPPEITYIV